MQLRPTLFFVLSCIAISKQDCKVLTDCRDRSIQWKTPHHVMRGPKGEPGTVLKQEVSHTGPKLHYIASSMTWNSGRSFCDTMNKRLCYANELCESNNGGNKFLFNVIPGDNWVPVLDIKNEWLEIGDSLRRTCFVHSQQYGKPPWGIATDPRPYKGFVYCCDNDQGFTYRDISYQYIGKTTTYNSSRQHCISEEKRLCRADEVCQQETPVFGVVNRDMWVAVSDGENEWVKIGRETGGVCVKHESRNGAPLWGNREFGSVEYVGYVYCCQI